MTVIRLENFRQEARVKVRSLLKKHPELQRPEPPSFIEGSSLGMGDGTVQVVTIYDQDETRLHQVQRVIESLEIEKITGRPWMAIGHRALFITGASPSAPAKSEVRKPTSAAVIA